MQARPTFQTIGIISRPRRANLAAVVPPLLQWLAARGIRAIYDEETASSLPNGGTGLTRQQVATESQLLLVLGGDGTLLSAARVAAPRGIPILPINMGSLGFLTSFMLGELYPALEETLAGRYPVSERVMLHVELERPGKVIEIHSVLNDVVINKGALARMMELQLIIDGEFVCRYRADGLIVASPTGSTAYSLSAGGPIVHPAVEAFVITPICPHTLSDRPVAIRDSSAIEIKLAGNTESVFLTLDGQTGIPLQAADCVHITRAPNVLKLIQPPNKSYFEILRSKLKWGEA
ncbi:MAG TPA: NAD(+)/NADH kinase [Candidatus Dormibacteraeota bacterium]|nr:NAD(+)/NADH kinase [Candidatus Dormibacteraeota bacterium]